MIIRIEASGGSFRGAGKYYLHDKAADAGIDKTLKPSSDERVWFADTRNTLNTDPEHALDEMWRTAEDQAHLKMQAGVKRGGRVCEDPVKTISLSWHKEDRPSPEHMIESADAFLKHMGWDNHQAVYVGHNDTEHRHIHIILNRVNHENGRTIDDYRERKRAQSWALAYEKEHDNVRCEERELRAAMREQRAPELNDGRLATPAPQHDQSSQQPNRTPANDHLPHNVVMLARPLEKEFAADEQRRTAHDAHDRAELKIQQRVEREAFFEDGPKLFKATRHAVYDEVRKEYKPEWKQFYQDAAEATREAESASSNSITRALYFAKDGRWEEARAAFSDRNSVRDDVAKELAERKADIKERQTQDLRERQRDACDALREVRDVQYQDLLQRHRDERAALTAGLAMESAGGPSQTPVDGLSKASPEPSANENQPAAPVQQAPRSEEAGQTHPSPQNNTGKEEQPSVTLQSLGEAVNSQEGGFVDLPSHHFPPSEGPAPARGVSDLAAGAVGSLASYLADQLGELFAPTPPEVREAQAKEAAKHEAEKPAADPTPSPYAKIIDAAMRVVEEERVQQAENTYWKERDRGKGWERDQ